MHAACFWKDSSPLLYVSARKILLGCMFHTPVQGSTHQHLFYGWVQVWSMQGDVASVGEASGGAV